MQERVVRFCGELSLNPSCDRFHELLLYEIAVLGFEADIPGVSEPTSMFWGVTTGFFKGLAQGAANVVNGVQDAAVGLANLPVQGANLIADGIDYAAGTPEHQKIRIPTIPSPDWSRNLITEEYGTPGGWDDTHGWSKFAGGEGVMALLTAGGSKAAAAVDEAGNCANWVAKFVRGGCFVSGTLVTLSELPFEDSLESQIWSSDEWYRTANSNSSTAVTKRILTPIEQVPLGARVPTKNPKPWEFDDSLPEPVQDEWLKLSITIERTDGGVVDAELLRPRAWVEANGIRAGQLLPLNIAELQVAGFAHVTAIEPCPVVASGEGSVITGRFATRQVDTIARVEILGADGSTEVLQGTTIHPIWSLDRNDWVPLGELQQGEQLLGQAGPALVLTHAILQLTLPVYNIEVHGEHVYQVGELGVMVHNVGAGCHHFAPRAWGSNVPYGTKYLKHLDEIEHPSIHRGFTDFLKDRVGHYFNALSGREWQSTLDYRTRRSLLIEFHKTFDDGKYWDDFVKEITKARKNGYNPWGA